MNLNEDIGVKWEGKGRRRGGGGEEEGGNLAIIARVAIV